MVAAYRRTHNPSWLAWLEVYAHSVLSLLREGHSLP